MRPVLLFLCWLLLAGTAQAATLAWDYDTSTGLAIPSTVILQRSQVSTGPFADVVTVPSLPSSMTEPAVPAGWLAVYYRIHNAGGDSNVIGYVIPIIVPSPPAPTLDDRVEMLEQEMSANATTDQAIAADITTMKAREASLAGSTSLAASQLAGICRAAKAMGGSATSLAGRLRKEIPCP